jgi:predicted RNA-binding protein with PIN domain
MRGPAGFRRIVMPYIVDGNNVMAVLHRDKTLARRLLVGYLAKFVAATRVKLKVVFDGVADDEFPDGLKTRGVHILYARIGSDADTRIKELVSKSSYKRDITVVTSDKPLTSFVRHQGTRSITSFKFRKILEECEKAAQAAEKQSAGPIDVDDWMRYFSLR